MQEGPKQIHRVRVADPLGPRLDPRRQSRKRREPVAVKQKTGAPVGMLATLAAGGLFCAYAFNADGAKDALDGWFNGLTAAAQSHNQEVGEGFVTLLPFLGIAVALGVAVLLVKTMVGKKKKAKPRELREQMTVHEFAELMASRGVGARVAREAYRMLMPDYGERLRSTVEMSFAELEVSRETVGGMLEVLAEKSGGVLRGSLPGMTTMMELLIAAEGSVERAALERRQSLRDVVLQERHTVVVPMQQR